MEIFIENPSGTTLKKEFNEKTAKWKTIGNLASDYPFPYGYLKNTMQEDGDPLDAFLITHDSTKVKRGGVFKVTVLGLAKYFEDGERDYKVIVRKKKEDIGLTMRKKGRIKHFLLHAFDNIEGKKVEFGGFSGVKKALIEIKRCMG